MIIKLAFLYQIICGCRSVKLTVRPKSRQQNLVALFISPSSTSSSSSITQNMRLLSSYILRIMLLVEIFDQPVREVRQYLGQICQLFAEFLEIFELLIIIHSRSDRTTTATATRRGRRWCCRHRLCARSIRSFDSCIFDFVLLFLLIITKFLLEYVRVHQRQILLNKGATFECSLQLVSGLF